MAKRCARVPVIMQMEALECGAAALAMVLAYYGKWLPLEKVRVDCGVSRDGSNARNMLRAARSYGMEAKGYRYEPAQLRQSGAFPCVIHWNFNHFVVLCGFRGKKALLCDPARGKVWVSAEEFDRSFTGVTLVFSPGPDFRREGKPRSVLAFARERLAGQRAPFAFVALTSLVLSVLGVAHPAFSRVFLDRVLIARSPAWLPWFLGVMLAVAAVEIAVRAAQALYMLRLQGKLAVVANSAFMWHVLRLPMGFFSQRMAGDLAARQEANEGIAAALMEELAPLLLQFCMLVFYLVVMLRYSLLLTAVGVSSVALNVLAAQLISRKRLNVTRVQMRDAGKLASATVAGIEMIETIKASGAENGYFERWAGYQASVNRQDVAYTHLNQVLGAAPGLITALADAAVVLLGVAMAMRGEMTPGMILAFQGFLSAFLQPASSLIGAGQSLQEMRANMERVEDVMHYPAEVPSSEAPPAPGESCAKLSGAVELKNVTFGYSPLAEPLIRDFSLSLRAGGSVAFVGASGCGKSTLAKLISGLYRPWSGEILFDGRPIDSIPRSVLRGSVAVVDQDITLFADSIRQNIKMWDESIEDFEMILASRDAQMHADILQRDGGYDYRMMEGGRDFSGGQRQRLEIARVLAQDPTVIVLDEATSALDARTEYETVKAIRERGVSTIVVAHRLSTIRDCDEIIVLDKGLVVERGTHEELYRRGGLYAQLVASE